MKKFLIMILAEIFCFSALAFAGCDSATAEDKNTVKYSEEKITFTLDTEIYSCSVEDMVYVDIFKRNFSSNPNTIENKEDIKDFFNTLFGGTQKTLKFYSVSEEEYRPVFYNTSMVYISGKEKSFWFNIVKDERKICYLNEENYYFADTGDFSELYEKYIVKS